MTFYPINVKNPIVKISNSQQLARAKMLQHSTAMYDFSYTSWLQLAAVNTRAAASIF